MISFVLKFIANIPMKLLESQETKSGGSSGESRKSAEGARSFTWLNLSGKRTERTSHFIL